MRAPSTLVALTLVVAACGGGADTVAPPPPPPSGNGQGSAPASIAIQSGDNQEANPGLPVPVRPAVVVRDASGRGVAGVAVTFTVQAGGGSIAGGSATTASDGVATAGPWTLGPAEGANSLDARVAALPAVTFHATAKATPRVVADTALGTGGGTIRLAGTGTRYDGLELAIPGGAFSASGHWTIRVDPTRQLPTLPAGVTVSGPMLVISTDQGRATRLLTLRVPVTQQPGRVNVMVVRDPLRNVVEVLPSLGGDASSILVGTSHLNAGLLPGPAGPPGLRAGGRAAIFDGLDGFIASVPASALTTILPLMGQVLDAFPIAEFGSSLFPDGHGPAGPLLTIISKFLGSQSLGTLFKPASVPGMHLDSLTLAAVVAIGRRFQAEGLKIAPVFSDVGVILGPLPVFQRDSLANLNLRAMMLFSKLPQLFMMPKSLTGPTFPASDVGFGTAFAATDNSISVVDPVAPRTSKSLGFGGGGFLSKAFRASGNGLPQIAAGILPLGMSALFPVEQFTDIVRNFLDRLMGPLLSEAKLPPVFLELRNAANMDWVKIVGEAQARSATAEIRLRCEACPGSAPFADDPQIKEIVAVDPVTQQETSRSTGGGAGGLGLGGLLGGLPNGAVARLLGGSLSKILPSGISLMLSPITVSIRNLVMTLDPATQSIALGAEAAFTVRKSALGKTGVIEWKFGDETPPETGAPKDTTATHVYAKEGEFTVEATLLLDGKRIASVTSTVKVADPNKWKLVSLSGTAPGWTPVSVATPYQQLKAFFELLKGTPGNGTFEFTPATNRMMLRMSPPAQGLPAQVVTAIGTSSDCDVANSGNGTGTTTTGYIFGQAVYACVKAANRDLASVVVSIDATKSGDDLAGTITVAFTDYDGHVETEVVPPKVITRFYIDHILETRTVTWTFSARRGP